MKLVVVLVSLCVVQCQSSKILVITSMSAHSHFTLAFRLAKELADRGHQVTFINPFPQKVPIDNLKDVPIKEVQEFVEEIRKKLFSSSTSVFGNVLENIELGCGITEYALNNTSVQKLLNSGEKFDVVILEHFLNEALMGIAHHFKAPLVLLAPIPASKKTNHLFANPGPSSYVPDIMGTYTKHMNFWERLDNFISINFDYILNEFLYMPKQRELFKKYFKSDIELDDLLYNISLLLTTSHPSVNDAVPHVPSVIEIGGFHVNPPKALPGDLQKFLDEAKEGVVLFSMGSNLKSKDLKPEVRDGILKTFAKIKQKVLWKFETELPNAPKNVKIMKWLPQQDILAHPNVHVFITHGGLLSTIETVTRGVPIIGIPVFGDQKANIASAVANGYAVAVPLEELSEEKLSWALNEILNNPRYRENVKQRSRVMNDQPLKPIDSAVYWVEHVLRHKGAPHLRSAGVDLKWYQREMIDIAIFLALISVISLVIIFKIVKALLGLCSRKQPKVTKGKKNK